LPELRKIDVDVVFRDEGIHRYHRDAGFRSARF
jgi:hypothetical protein